METRHEKCECLCVGLTNKNNERKNMNKTLAQILANLQSDVSDLANFVNNNGGTTPPNSTVTAALAAVQSSMVTLQNDANAGNIAAVQADVANALNLIAALAAAINNTSTTASTPGNSVTRR